MVRAATAPATRSVWRSDSESERGRVNAPASIEEVKGPIANIAGRGRPTSTPAPPSRSPATRVSSTTFPGALGALSRTRAHALADALSTSGFFDVTVPGGGLLLWPRLIDDPVDNDRLAADAQGRPSWVFSVQEIRTPRGFVRV